MSPTRTRIESLLERRREIWSALSRDHTRHELRAEREAIDDELVHLWATVRDEQVGVNLFCSTCNMRVTRDALHDVNGSHARSTYLRLGQRRIGAIQNALKKINRALAPAT